MAYLRTTLLELAHGYLSRSPGIKLVDLARVCSVSVVTLARAMRTEDGRTYRAWHRELLESAAKEYLVGLPPRSIKEISASLGFSRSSSFARWFCRQTGLSPTAYRERSLVRGVEPAPADTRGTDVAGGGAPGGGDRAR